MNNIPDDIILQLSKLILNPKDLLNFKITCKSYNKIITTFSLSKLIILGKINYKPIEMCINNDCYDDTSDIYENVYHYGYRRYIHFHQYALNQELITINKNKYKIFTPYCSECFTQYVLIGDKENFTRNLMIDKVNIEY